MMKCGISGLSASATRDQKDECNRLENRSTLYSKKIMPQGDKSSYSNKQKRQAEHIEEGYEHRGLSAEESKRRAWATVNKMTGGGKKSGSGRGKKVNLSPARKAKIRA
jgi:plasmid stabilization system protein ParE